MEEKRNSRAARGGAANMPPGPEPAAVGSAADPPLPEESGGMRDPQRTATEREPERTREVLAEAEAPVDREQTREAIARAADRLRDGPEVTRQVKRTAAAEEEDAPVGRGKLREVAGEAEARATGALDAAAEGVDRAGRRLDRFADERLSGRSGMGARAAEAAHGVSEALDPDAGGFLRGVERQVRERPARTLLIGLAAGWVVGKILR